MPTLTTKQENELMLSKIRRAALDGGASYLKLLNQSYGQLAEALTAQGMKGGVCRRLAVLWMSARKDDKDFMASLMIGNSQVNSELAGQIVKDQKSGASGERAKDMESLKRELSHLGLHAIDCRTAGERGPLGKENVADWLCDRSVFGRFRFLGIWGTYDHAIAVEVSDDGACFFDPNLGEIRFNSVDTLKNFINTSILPKPDPDNLPSLTPYILKKFPQYMDADLRKNKNKHALAWYLNNETFRINNVDLLSCNPLNPLSADFFNALGK